jgi:hypothetical protein
LKCNKSKKTPSDTARNQTLAVQPLANFKLIQLSPQCLERKVPLLRSDENKPLKHLKKESSIPKPINFITQESPITVVSVNFSFHVQKVLQLYKKSTIILAVFFRNALYVLDENFFF